MLGRAASSRSTCWGWGCSRRWSGRSTRSRAPAASGSTSRGSRWTIRRRSGRSARRHHRRLPDREPGADADAAAHAAREHRRPDRAGGAGAPGADSGRRRSSLPRAAHAAAEGPRLPGPLRAPVAGADPRGHAGDDRLPGAGDPGGDGACRVRRWRGRGAAPGDEPQALRGRRSSPTGTSSSTARWSAASSREIGERVFEQIRGFSGFGFPKAHAAAFGLLAYQSTWLRVHYGPEFLCSLLNEQPMGFYPPDALVHEAQRRGIEVLPPDVNRERRRVHRRGGAGPVRIGLGYITGLRADEARGAGRRARARRALRDLADLASRSGLGADGLERLAWAGACDARSAAAHELRGAARTSGGSGSPRGAARRRAGAPSSPSHSRSRPRPTLRELDSWERLRGRLRVDRDDDRRAPDGADPAGARRGTGHEPGPGRPGRRGRVSRSPGWSSPASGPATANGVVFMLLEDEGGTINLIVPPPVYERHRLAVRTASVRRAWTAGSSAARGS